MGGRLGTSWVKKGSFGMSIFFSGRGVARSGQANNVYDSIRYHGLFTRRKDTQHSALRSDGADWLISMAHWPRVFCFVFLFLFFDGLPAGLSLWPTLSKMMMGWMR
jgi:hypothetical protein